MTDATQDPARPHVTWCTPDPQAARIAELARAMRHIRTLATPDGGVNPAFVLAPIYRIATDALASAEPCATVEAVVI